jgi:hypothetical protein
MPQRVLEIGIGGAASTLAFAEALRLNGRGRLISIDLDDALIQRAQLLLKIHGLSRLSTIIRGKSTDLATKKQVVEQASQVDILFIDGDHSFAGCRADFVRYRDLLSPKGLVLFHDTGPFPPAEAELVMQLPVDAGEGRPVWNRNHSGIYHRPDVARVMDEIMKQHPEYSLLSLHTLVEPCCGLAVLQRTQMLFQPEDFKVPSSG